MCYSLALQVVILWGIISQKKILNPLNKAHSVSIKAVLNLQIKNANNVHSYYIL